MRIRYVPACAACSDSARNPALSSPADSAIVKQAAVEVLKPALFGMVIIIAAYIPILTLSGIEGKMFRPMALTVVFALIGSLVLALTLMPVLASLGFKAESSFEDIIRIHIEDELGGRIA